MIPTDRLTRARWIDALCDTIDLITDITIEDDEGPYPPVLHGELLTAASRLSIELDTMLDALKVADREAA